MIIGEKENGQAILLRCGCSHNFCDDYSNHDTTFKVKDSDYCQKCKLYGWRITGMTDEELRRREVD